MRILTATLAVLVLTCAPVQAQPPTPTPPGSSTLGGIARDVQETGDAIGSLATTIGANNFLILLVVILLGMIIWFGIRPGMGTTAASQRDLATTNRELLTHLRSSDKVVDRNTEAFEGVKASNVATADAYSTLTKTVHDSWTNLKTLWHEDRETKRLADMQTQQQINEMNQRLDAVVDVIKGIQNEIIPGGGYRRALDKVIWMLEGSKLNDTGQLPPLDSITDRDPHAPSANDKHTREE